MDEESGRNLRKRRINLNELVISASQPKVCQLGTCGIQLKKGECLDKHYQGHLDHELAKLERGVRVKKNPKDFPDREGRMRVRKSALQKIKQRREARNNPGSSGLEEADAPNADDIRCPVCDEALGLDDVSLVSL